MSQTFIDLRSDTVTKPTPEMLQYMLSADVGDDVFSEDLTTKKLEEKVAHLFGMEAGLFCPSETMCNQIAIKAHTQPMDEIICDQRSHIYQYENGGYAFLSGCSIRLINGNRGIISDNQIEENILPKHDWLPKSRLVVVENTCNRGGGSVYTLDQLIRIHNCCQKNQLKLHLDGARIFNALISQQITPADVHGLFDSISICLSKGLGAPVGSVLLGSNDFIKESRRIRKGLGGGMRQSGYIAAAGLFAIEHHVDRLKEDHIHANMLEKTLHACSFVEKVLPVDTNIVIFDVKSTYSVESMIAHLKKEHILAIPFGNRSVRMVTHLDVNRKQIENVCDVLHKM